jgi:predicted dinucleotide-binding enzyme
VAVSDSTVAIIGTGNIGSTLGGELRAGGQDFLLAGPRPGGRPEARLRLGGHAKW